MPSTLLILYGMDFPTICFSAAAASNAFFLKHVKFILNRLELNYFTDFTIGYP